jgi:transcriptional regulator with XRE-family HTH domain
LKKPEILVPDSDSLNQIPYSSISTGNRVPAGAITFALLESRLLGHLRDKIRKGEVTERSLARITGISQPHLHNVLKGKRLLSTEKADRILSQLRLDLRALLDQRDPT